MKPGKILTFAARVGVLALVVAGATGYGAVAGEPASLAVAIPTDPDFYIQDWPAPTALNEMRPDVAYNSDDDEYLVVFDWDFGGPGDRDVMFVIVYPDGSIAPMPIAVADDTNFDDSNPAVAYNPDDGNYMVVWERRDSGGVAQIFGSIVTDHVAGAPFSIMVGNANHLGPDVAYSTGAGRYLVVWEDHGAGWTLPPDTMSASYNGAGGDGRYLHIAPQPVTQSSLQTRPAVTAHGTAARWMVVWEDSRTAGTTGIDVYGQQIEFDSDTLDLYGGAIAVGTTLGDAEGPDVAWGPVGVHGGEYLVVWIENEVIDLVFAQRVEGIGTLAGAPIVVSNHGESTKYDPRVVFATGSNAWWTVWRNNREYG
jgi:hypothetical protein